MKKIISGLLALSFCFAVNIYAEERDVSSVEEPMVENADVLLDYENLNNNIELKLSPVIEQEVIETFIADEPEVLTEDAEDTEVELYAATTIIDSGSCGDNLTWDVDSGGTLTIHGTGTFADYRSDSEVPWNGYASDIVKLKLDITDSIQFTDYRCYAFNMLVKVTELIIPEGVTSIGDSPYALPRSLRKLYLPSTYTGNLSRNQSIREMYFMDVEVSEDNPLYCSVDGTLFNKDRTKLIQYTRSWIEPNYVIPETVTDIDGAFCGNAYLQTLTISKNVEIVDTDIYNNIFYHEGLGSDARISQCRAVYVDSDNPYYCSVDGVLYNKDMSMIIWCPPMKTGSFYIPETVEVIAPGAFEYSRCSYVHIPNSVKIIGAYSFLGSCIEHITLPESIESIYQSCICFCSYLTKVYIEIKETASYSYQLFESYNLKTAGPMGSGCDIEFCWTTRIPSSVFYHCPNLIQITIPDSVTSIGDSVFYNCTGLTEITFSENLTDIGSNAFCFCDGLTKITIPNKVESIGYSAFYKCMGLTEVNIPHSVTTIDSYAFDECIALTDIYIDKAEGTIAETWWAAQNTNVTYLREINIEPTPKSYIYTGYEIAPDISISEDRKDGTASTTLIEDKDYTLTYSNNTNAGTAEITVSYINNYVNLSDDELTFTIMPKDCSELIIAPISDKAYTSRAITPIPTITDTTR